MLENERKLYEHQIERFITRLKTLFYEDEILLEAEYCNFGKQSPIYKNRRNGKFKPIKVGDTWGKNWEQAWFHVQGKVPKSWKGKFAAARLNLGGEGCIFNKKGEPEFAISFHSLWMTDFRRDRYIIAEKSNGSEKIDLWIDATASQLFGLQLFEDPRLDDPKKFGHYEAKVVDLALGKFRQDIWQLYMDVIVLDNLMRDLPEDSVRRARILQALTEVVDQFDTPESTIAACSKRLRPELAKRSNASALSAVAVGHAHIDTAWLWPLRETRKKCARTFISQLDLINRYPGYIFGASQAQHYQFIKEDHPALYKQIKAQVKAKRWEIQGGMWLEADCNLISGESMVRQFIHGMNFFKDEFGATVKNLWLPDVFGYSAAMPQILQKLNIDVMVTQKISWSQFNKFPNHTFVWAGIDGSEIVVHFPPEDTYNSELKPAGMRNAQKNFAEKAVLDDFLVVYGIGDGGGGPTEEILESGIRQRNLEGVPKVQFSAAQPLLNKFLRQREKLPKWNGELYLELHRGTLTTQAYNKKMNRYMELKLRELEFLYSAFDRKNYPAKEFDHIWKIVLLNQFHDIIPGSSIHIVYDDSKEQYEDVKAQASALYDRFLKSQSKSKNSLTIVNTLSFTYERPVALPDGWKDSEILDADDQPQKIQQVGDTAYLIRKIAPLSTVTLKKGSKRASQKKRRISKKHIFENDLIRYEFDKAGQITRIYDKEAQREVLAKGQRGNVFSLYEDRPNAWDAWDVDIFYEKQFREHGALTKWQWISEGPDLQCADLSFTVSNSTIQQRITLSANSKRLEFATRAHWQESHKMLRVGFTVDIRSRQATYEIQYGNIQRPTHRNTSWDMAQFEVVGHRYADLSDDAYGVAVMNDCKYGHKIHGNFIELNLLRAPSSPDPEADLGDHEFTYALLPHQYDLKRSNVISESFQLNQPVALLPGAESIHNEFPIQLSNEDVIVEVLKKAEKENALIVRLYEPKGTETETTLTLADNAKLLETNLLEDGGRRVALKNREAVLKFKPFEIRTFKIL